MNNFTGIIFAGLIVGFLVISYVTAPNSLKSLDQALEYYTELGGLGYEGAPVIVFVREKCPACENLEGALRSIGVRFIRSDVDRNPLAKQIWVSLGRGVFGVAFNVEIPTAIVGTRILRSPSASQIEMEVRNQSGMFLREELLRKKGKMPASQAA